MGRFSKFCPCTYAYIPRTPAFCTLTTTNGCPANPRAGFSFPSAFPAMQVPGRISRPISPTSAEKSFHSNRSEVGLAANWIQVFSQSGDTLNFWELGTRGALWMGGSEIGAQELGAP